jgi:hypothetical protein
MAAAGVNPLVSRLAAADPAEAQLGSARGRAAEVGRRLGMLIRPAGWPRERWCAVRGCRGVVVQQVQSTPIQRAACARSAR